MRKYETIRYFIIPASTSLIPLATFRSLDEAHSKNEQPACSEAELINTALKTALHLIASYFKLDNIVATLITTRICVGWFEELVRNLVKNKQNCWLLVISNSWVPSSSSSNSSACMHAKLFWSQIMQISSNFSRQCSEVTYECFQLSLAI